MEKKDKILLGLVTGMIAPLVGFVIYWKLNFSELSFHVFLNHVSGRNARAALISLCLLANLACFFFFLNRDMFKSARGVIGATFVYGIYILYLKFF